MNQLPPCTLHQQLRYTLTSCPLGQLLLAGSERGLAVLYLGDNREALLATLRQDYPKTQLQRDPAGLGPWCDRIRDYLQGKRPWKPVPLDPAGTPFQRRVWQELQAIPPGTTRTYGDIARQLGKPTAARAVAGACAANPISLIIPCHRVVRGDGGLGGYRWGLERKRKLLEREGYFENHEKHEKEIKKAKTKKPPKSGR
jgi:AraC family transcriptional regulator of adaptative response/methylated-DNA-[protein]-cysteine methyltransferase